jgi:two-component system, cell cycle response regulator
MQAGRILIVGEAPLAVEALERAQFKVSVCAPSAGLEPELALFCPDIVLVHCAPDGGDVANLVSRLAAARPVASSQGAPFAVAVAAPVSVAGSSAWASAVDDLLIGALSPVRLVARMVALARLVKMQRELTRRALTRDMFEFLPESSPPQLSFERDLKARNGWRILFVGPGLPSGKVDDLAHGLTGLGTLVRAGDDEEAMAALLRDGADVCVVVCGAQEAEGLTWAAALRNSPSFFNLPILLFAEPGAALDLDRAYQAGVQDALNWDASLDDVKARIGAAIRVEAIRQHLTAIYQQGADAHVRDSLTALYNRGFAMEHLERLITDANRTGRALSVGLLRLTSLGLINSRLGYAVGDAVLRAVAERVRRQLRAEDLAARWSGDTLLLLMPESTQAQARIAANRLLNILRYAAIDLPADAGTVIPELELTTLAWNGDASADGLLKRVKGQAALAA